MKEEFLEKAKEILKSITNGKELTVRSEVLRQAENRIASTLERGQNVAIDLETVLRNNANFLLERGFTIDDIVIMLSKTSILSLFRPETVKSKYNILVNMGFKASEVNKMISKVPAVLAFREDRISQLRIKYGLALDEIVQICLIDPKFLVHPEEEFKNEASKAKEIIAETNDLSQHMFSLETIYSVVCMKSFVPMWKIKILISHVLGKDISDVSLDDLDEARLAIIEQYPPLEGIAYMTFETREDLEKFFDDQKLLNGPMLMIKPLGKTAADDSDGGMSM